MKALLVSFWKRRWCRAALCVSVALGLACLHPSLRQRVFGPTIDGIPWCEWEREIRAQADPPHVSGLWRTLLNMGLYHPFGRGIKLEEHDVLPVIEKLAEDRNERVRQYCLSHLNRRDPGHADILPILSRHLQDSDPGCRIRAAAGLLEATGDLKMLAVLEAALDHPDRTVHAHAFDSLMYLMQRPKPRCPELFTPMAKLCEHPDAHIRGCAIGTMFHFGKRGVPVVQKGFQDPFPTVRGWSIRAAVRLDADYAEFLPALRKLQNDPDSWNRTHAQSAVELLERLQPHQAHKGN